jgi:hypothetical protein
MAKRKKSPAKKAAKNYRYGYKLKPRKKKSVPKKHKQSAMKQNRKIRKRITAVYHMKKAKDLLEDKLGETYVKQTAAKKKSVKKKFGKEIAKLKGQIRRLS